MPRTTSAARAHARRDRRTSALSPRLLGGLALGGALLAPLATAAPALADTATGASPTTASQDAQGSGSQQPGSPTSDVGQDPLTGVVGGGLSSIPGSDSPKTADDPTPAPEAPQYGAKPETVLLGVPVEGTIQSVQKAQSIIPGSGPGDYA